MAGGDAPRVWFDHSARTFIGAAALAIALMTTGPVVADSAPPLQLASAALAQSRDQPDKPNVFERFTRWLDRSVTDLSDGVKQSFGRVDTFGDRTKNAVKGTAQDLSKGLSKDLSDTAQSLAAIPDMRVVTQRQLCPPAANGAPDCRRAADAVCRGKGFGAGKSLETRSEEKCSLDALLARRAGQPDTCRHETYVLRSMCQ